MARSVQYYYLYCSGFPLSLHRSVAILMKRSFSVECCQGDKDRAGAICFLETKNDLSNFWSLQHLSLVTLHESVEWTNSFSIATSKDTAGLVPFRLGFFSTLLNLPMGICKGGKPTSRSNSILWANKHVSCLLSQVAATKQWPIAWMACNRSETHCKSFFFWSWLFLIDNQKKNKIV